MVIPYFSNIITIIRKYKVSISIILQSISQLEAKYWKSEADIILNWWISSKIFYNWADPSTTEMLSKILWTTTQQDENTNFKRKENLLNSFNIRTLWDNQAIYIYWNKQPILLDILPYYNNKRFKKILL
jgi:type IV secretory pathway TraG/TraD family ATPase VirD4